MNQRQAGGMGDELTNAALIGLIAMFGIALVLRAAGSVAAFLTGTPQPDAGAAAGLAVLFNPADPATALGAGQAEGGRGRPELVGLLPVHDPGLGVREQ